MRAVCSGTDGIGCCGWSDMAKPPEITAPTPLSTLRLTHSPTVSGHRWDALLQADLLGQGLVDRTGALRLDIPKQSGGAVPVVQPARVVGDRIPADPLDRHPEYPGLGHLID